jgi:sugar/nucleoside kinase (ribokinase family)
MNKRIRISGTGCALADFVYNGIDFSGTEFQKYISCKNGDGGLSPGKLVFTEELEKFAGRTYETIISEITKGVEADTFNIGGPSLVSLIHVAQVLDPNDFKVDFFGISGSDEIGEKIRELLQKTPIGISNYLGKSEKPTPFTHVLSDPKYDSGNGERTFINEIGAAWDLEPEELPFEFFKADIVCSIVMAFLSMAWQCQYE